MQIVQSTIADVPDAPSRYGGSATFQIARDERQRVREMISALRLRHEETCPFPWLLVLFTVYGAESAMRELSNRIEAMRTEAWVDRQW